MKYFFLTLSLLISTLIGYSQTLRVLYAETNEPVPFATFIFKKESKNIFSDYTDEKGIITFPESIDFDVFEISCVGFKSQLIFKDNKVADTIYLEKQIIMLEEVVVTKSNPVIHGEFGAKQTNLLALTKQYIVSYYFENIFDGQPVVQSFIFKVDKVHQKTAIRIHLYKRYDYTQLSYHPKTGEEDKYDTFIPGEELLADNIIYYIEPQDKGIVEIDLLKYEIVVPENGIFAAIECLGYYNDKGVLTDSSVKPTSLIMHHTDTDNYCGKFIIHNSWRNINRWVKHDYETVFKSIPNKKMLLAPTFGLKILIE